MTESEEKSITERLQNTWMSKNETFLFPSASPPDHETTKKSNNTSQRTNWSRTHRLRQLKNRWDESIATMMKTNEKSVELNNDACNKWFDDIVKRHTTTSGNEARFYHTLVHLEEMLEYVDIFLDPSTFSSSSSSSSSACKEKVIHRAVLIVSTFFHDVIYDAKSSTNEEDSAVLFRKFAKEVLLPEASSFDSKDDNLSNDDDDEAKISSNAAGDGTTTATDLVNRVESYIIATKSHSSDNNDGYDEGTIYYQQLFLDIDMSVLGKISPQAYDSYAYAIRQEYSFVPHEVYCEKRAEVLSTFLDRQCIFENKIMKNVLEGHCRDNLRREVDLLKKGLIPCQEEKEGGEK